MYDPVRIYQVLVTTLSVFVFVACVCVCVCVSRRGSQKKVFSLRAVQCTFDSRLKISHSAGFRVKVKNPQLPYFFFQGYIKFLGEDDDWHALRPLS